MNRSGFVRSLRAEAANGSVRLYVSEPSGRQRIVACAYRRRNIRFGFVAAPGIGITIHRQGFSIVGIPRSGGTSLLWGRLKRRVERDGRDNRKLCLGPIGVFIGSDF